MFFNQVPNWFLCLCFHDLQIHAPEHTQSNLPTTFRWLPTTLRSSSNSLTQLTGPLRSDCLINLKLPLLTTAAFHNSNATILKNSTENILRVTHTLSAPSLTSPHSSELNSVCWLPGNTLRPLIFAHPCAAKAPWADSYHTVNTFSPSLHPSL